jgi:NAD-dependent oxidoreductase involved in siderophore biosynthesis
MIGLPASAYCRTAELRELFYGLLGPEATSVTYTLAGQQHTIKPVGPEGAYLIVAHRLALQTPHGLRLLGGAAGSIMPLQWSSPITSIEYRNGKRCLIAATEPGTLKGQCRPPGYRPVTTRGLSDVQVAAPIHVRVIATPPADRAALASRRAILVSFTARVAVRKASSSYEIVEDTSSPEAVFEATQRDINAGQTVTWLLPAPKPGVYSGKIVLGLGGAPPNPIYTYSPGPLVGRFSVRVP